MGSHALSKHYRDKETFLKTSVARINNVLDGTMKLEVKSIIGGEVDSWVVVEMVSLAKCKNGRLISYIAEFEVVEWSGDILF